MYFCLFFSVIFLPISAHRALYDSFSLMASPLHSTRVWTWGSDGGRCPRAAFVSWNILHFHSSSLISPRALLEAADNPDLSLTFQAENPCSCTTAVSVRHLTGFTIVFTHCQLVDSSGHCRNKQPLTVVDLRLTACPRGSLHARIRC